MTIIVRGFGAGQQVFEERIQHLNGPDNDPQASFDILQSLAVDHISRVSRYPQHCLEFENPDCPNPAQRYSYFGTDRFTIMRRIGLHSQPLN